VLDEVTWQWLDPDVVLARAASAHAQYEVVVTDMGPDPGAAVKALAEATSSSMSLARRMIRKVPATVGYGLSRGRATAIRDVVETAGGSVKLNERRLANVPAGP
jgi:hypothetical protein